MHSKYLLRNNTMLDREALIERLAHRSKFTVVIIGAGINGIGTFRDLALQGVDCLIVDKGDFCSGASGASSRVMHGGLKYLETGQFRLVMEAVVERNRLIRNAPHVVRPHETVVLFHSWWGGSIAAVKRFFGWSAKANNRGALIIKFGLEIFDFFGRRERETSRHKFLTRKNLIRSLPAVDPRVVAGASYFDACIAQPERLGLELVVDAINANPDCIGLNYVSLISTNNGALKLREEISGRSFEVRPTIVVNAAGAWIDFTNRTMEIDHRYIGGTKGSHLVLDHTVLHEQLAGRMVLFDSADGRTCFTYPLLDKILLGSTDLYISDPDEARCEDDEIDYLLEALRGTFPAIDIGRDNIVFVYSGVRPLPCDEASDPGQVTRDHSIRTDESSAERPYPVISLVGGKWTTFRAFSEETADMVLGRLGHARRNSTQERPIGGGSQFPKDAATLNEFLGDLTTRFDISKYRAKILVERYGSNAVAVAAHCHENADRPIGACSYTMQEIAYLAANEMAGRVLDILLRRTTIAISGQTEAGLVEEVAEIAGGVLGWNHTRVKEEIDRTIDELSKLHCLDTALSSPPSGVVRSSGDGFDRCSGE